MNGASLRMLVSPRPRQIDVDHFVDPARMSGHHHRLVRQIDRLIDIVGVTSTTVLRCSSQISSRKLCMMERVERIQGAERLIHQKRGWIDGQHARDRRALTHAARQFGRAPFAKSRQPRSLQHAFDDLLLGPPFRDLRAATCLGDVVLDRTATETKRFAERPRPGRAPARPTPGHPPEPVRPVGVSKPAMRFNKVDLPQPLAPTRAGRFPFPARPG